MFQEPDKSVAYHCPECGAATLNISAVIGGEVRCHACKWVGTHDELLMAPASPLTAEALSLFMDEIQAVFREISPKLAVILVRWGFMRQENIRTELPAYGKRIGVAVSTALLCAYRDLRMKKVRHNGG